MTFTLKTAGFRIFDLLKHLSERCNAYDREDVHLNFIHLNIVGIRNISSLNVWLCLVFPMFYETNDQRIYFYF